MLERKRLAYGDGVIAKPKMMKSLVFSATFLSIMCSCSPVTNAVPRRDPVLEEARQVRLSERPAHRQEAICRMRGTTLEYSSGGGLVRLTDILDAGERLAGVSCRGERAFVLSDRSLVIARPAHDPDLDGDGISFVASYSRTDMRSILAPGLVSWTQSDNAAYFLTRDGTLTEIPAENMGSMIPSFSIPYEVQGAQMAHHGGYLFLATRSGNMVVISGQDSAVIPFRTSVGNPAFYLSNGTLFSAGKESKKMK